MKATYTKEVIPKLQKELGIKNLHALPKIVSVHVNVGVGSYITGGKDYKDVVQNVEAITGQRPIVNKSRKSISNFKLRENVPNGVSVTLRGQRMYDFLNKLVNVVFPRIRDFRGISRKSFDGRGNYSLGIKEHTVFPEIKGEDVSKIHGIQITIKTTATSNEHGLKLLENLGFPFQKEVVKSTSA
ncbi:50S ribosomal protein L5 [Candidatus Peregrinibacteria bacterium CG11_big_fil_rev_8_21_14_0_20_46_8]|nr:MAG: 50S ribosomal protein L5 [Candidatus Peregrinibacteria bacterium CG11_big_fil_rev_8_21_14_0_20_46_8]